MSDDQDVEPARVARRPHRRLWVPPWASLGLLVVLVLLAWDGVQAWEIDHGLGASERDVALLSRPRRRPVVGFGPDTDRLERDATRRRPPRMTRSGC